LRQDKTEDETSLSAIAKQYLSVPASSTPCESFFSEGRLVCNYKSKKHFQKTDYYK
jgi:hypothetical protein